MSDSFDAYHLWLGIPPAEQPPNRYRLLGVSLFEQNPDVVDAAANRQTAHLRTYQMGEHPELLQTLLNEVAAARICLLDETQRAKYDSLLMAMSPNMETFTCSHCHTEMRWPVRPAKCSHCFHHVPEPSVPEPTPAPPTPEQPVEQPTWDTLCPQEEVPIDLVPIPSTEEPEIAWHQSPLQDVHLDFPGAVDNDWHFKSAGETYGPMSLGLLRQFAQVGQITFDTLVQKGTGGDWVAARHIKDLFLARHVKCLLETDED